MTRNRFSHQLICQRTTRLHCSDGQTRKWRIKDSGCQSPDAGGASVLASRSRRREEAPIFNHGWTQMNTDLTGANGENRGKPGTMNQELGTCAQSAWPACCPRIPRIPRLKNSSELIGCRICLPYFGHRDCLHARNRTETTNPC